MKNVIEVECRESSVGIEIESFPWTDKPFLMCCVCWAELDLASIKAEGVACGG